MLTKDKHVKRDTNALAMFFHSYLFDKLDNTLLDQIKSDTLVKHNGTVRHLKPCKIRVEVAWESGKGWEQGNPC